MDKDWNQDYIENGINAQRLYPNEALLQFMGATGLFKEEKKCRILEMGCGSGANLWMIAKEGHEAHGIDMSEEALNIAKNHLKEKWGVTATLKKGVFTEIPYEDQFFDYVVDIVSMQHMNLTDTLKSLKEVKRVLKPGGRFFSIRHGEGSTAYYNGFASDGKIDEVTLENVSDTKLPLNNNGTLSFWSSSIAIREYTKAGLAVESLERQIRTYNNGLYRVEYLVITAKK